MIADPAWRSQPLDIFHAGTINGPPMTRQLVMQWSVRALAALGAIFVLASSVDAAELVMYRRVGCSWCAAWDREIGPIYAKTDLDRRVALRMVELVRGGDPSVRTRSPIRYTPTFVLVENGEELGRIEGYPGDVFFWGLLEQLFALLPPAPKRTSGEPGGRRAL